MIPMTPMYTTAPYGIIRTIALAYALVFTGLKCRRRGRQLIVTDGVR